MRKKYRKRGTALLVGLVLAVSQPAASLLPALEVMAYTERSASINGTNVTSAADRAPPTPWSPD